MAWVKCEYHNCYSTQVVQKGFLELIKWCTRQTKWCVPLQKGLGVWVRPGNEATNCTWWQL